VARITRLDESGWQRCGLAVGSDMIALRHGTLRNA
jgi:hypothetical protein